MAAGNLEAISEGNADRAVEDYDLMRRAASKLASGAVRQIAFALQALLQQFLWGVGLGERLDKHRSEQKGDRGAGNRGVEEQPDTRYAAKPAAPSHDQ